MADFATLKTDRGDLKLASPRFSEEVTDLLEMLEDARAPKEDRDPKFRMSRVVKTLRKVMTQCAIDAGHSASEANELISRIELSENSLAENVNALGL